jgi:hypothetical protein
MQGWSTKMWSGREGLNIDVNHFHDHTSPHGYFCDDNCSHVLDEEYYKDIMKKVDPNWLPHKDYSPLIPYVRYVGTKGNIMKFFVPNKYNGWNTYIQFVEWHEQVDDMDLTAPEAARLLLWAGNIRVHCPCPAYKFWGMQYIMTKKKAAIIPEVRYPHIRNPNLKGVVCKHLNRTLKVLPFHLGSMASAVKEQRKKKG